jgi:hypothetical protein
MVDANGDGQVEDGGLPRHIITGGTFEHFETPKDFQKTLKTATVQFIPEQGTAAEKVAVCHRADRSRGLQAARPGTGTLMGTRDDGGPTSWKADIFWTPNNDPRNANAHRDQTGTASRP